MRWDIAPKVRCDLYTFSGINCAGNRRFSSIHPLGGLQKDKLQDARFQSLIIVAPPGTRITMMTTINETDWEERPWRTIEITKVWLERGVFPAPTVMRIEAAADVFAFLVRVLAM